MALDLSKLTPDTKQAVDRLIDYAISLGYDPKIVSAFRSCDEQNRIYAQGRTAPGSIVTNARGCVSWHTWGRAVDINLGSKATVPDYERLGVFWRTLGGKWGGDFKDYGHYEFHPGVSIGSVCPVPGDCSNMVYDAGLPAPAVGASDAKPTLSSATVKTGTNRWLWGSLACAAVVSGGLVVQNYINNRRS